MNRIKRSYAVHLGLCILVLGGIAACIRRQTVSSLTAEQASATTNGVRTFAATVAADVTRRGPAAWRDQFADTPTFFMASEGRLIFANHDEAMGGIQKLTETVAHIELRWNDPIRVDPLTPTLATLAMPYHEVRVDTTGQKVEESGYFTGLAELGSTGWKFRNAHWSVAGPSSPVP